MAPIASHIKTPFSSVYEYTKLHTGTWLLFSGCRTLSQNALANIKEHFASWQKSINELLFTVPHIFAISISHNFFITPKWSNTIFLYSKYKKRMYAVKLYKKFNLSNNNKPHSCVRCVHIETVFHSVFVCEAISMLISLYMMEASFLRLCIHYYSAFTRIFCILHLPHIWCPYILQIK